MTPPIQPNNFPWLGTIIPWSAALRSKPSKGSRVLADIQRGQVVKAVFRSKGWLYVEASLNGKQTSRGYVSKELIKYEPKDSAGSGGQALLASGRTTIATFEIHSSAGPVAKVGTAVEYSVHQIVPTIIASGSRYEFRWLVRNDPTTLPAGLPITISGPADARKWKLRASRPGVHCIEVTVLLGGSPLENIIFEQVVTDDGRSPLHKSIISEAKTPKVDANVKEWTTLDILKWKTPKVGDPQYIHEFKAQWVHGYREVIQAAAKRFDLPVLLVGGVAYAEVGGDPLWIDNVAYEIRSFDHLADPALEPMTVTKPADQTSFGNVSIQIRRAAEAMGYDPHELSNSQRNMIKTSLEEPRENLFIAAKHLADLRDIDFKGKGAVSMTLSDIQVTATRFNRGPDLGLDTIKKNTSYGDSILKRASNLSELLK